MRKRYGNKDYYIDNIHGVVNMGAYLIVYAIFGWWTFQVVYLKKINEVKILKCFEGLEEFLTKWDIWIHILPIKVPNFFGTFLIADDFCCFHNISR